MRKIKTFNVDENTYNELLSLFKKYGASSSLSSFVNNCLNELLTHIKEVEQVMKKHPNSEVQMSFVIENIARSLDNKKIVGPVLAVAGQGIDLQKAYEDELLEAWEDEYKAHQLGVPIEMYSYLESGKFVLAPNKQYLIEAETGKKFIVLPSQQRAGGGILGEIKEE